jgi:ADP-ribose pyrophosphatase YjhB (NUDIX family)
MEREFPSTPLVGVGAVVVEQGRVLLVRRGREPLKGHWSLPGGLLELGESLAAGVIREVREETGLRVEPVELIELLDRIHREGERVRFHYLIADYLCRVTGGALQAASDAEAVRWVERAEWNRQDASLGALRLDPVTVRVIEAGWQRAQVLRETRVGGEGALRQPEASEGSR